MIDEEIQRAKSETTYQPFEVASKFKLLYEFPCVVAISDSGRQ